MFVNMFIFPIGLVKIMDNDKKKRKREEKKEKREKDGSANRG